MKISTLSMGGISPMKNSLISLIKINSHLKLNENYKDHPIMLSSASLCSHPAPELEINYSKWAEKEIVCMENYTKNGLQGYDNRELRLFIITCSSFLLCISFHFSIFMVLCLSVVSRSIPSPCLPSFWLCTWYTKEQPPTPRRWPQYHRMFARAISLYTFMLL